LVKTLSETTRKMSDMKSKNNPFGLSNSYIWKFWKYEGDEKVDDLSQVSSFSNTEVYNKSLVLSSGTNGTATMISFEAPSNITRFSVFVSTDYKSDAIGNCSIKLSLNAGQTPSDISPFKLYTPESIGLSGKRISLIFEFKPDNLNVVPRVASIGFYYDP
jgi:hypothetical protein